MLCTKVWDYDRGETTHVGVGHGGEISKVKVAPDGGHIVSVSVDGAILRWKFPQPQEEAPSATIHQPQQQQQSEVQ